MACDCIDKMNAKMASRNTRLVGTMCWPKERAAEGLSVLGQPYDTISIVCEKIQPRNRDRVSALATFCPFCGVRYVAE